MPCQMDNCSIRSLARAFDLSPLFPSGAVVPLLEHLRGAVGAKQSAFLAPKFPEWSNDRSAFAIYL